MISELIEVYNSSKPLHIKKMTHPIFQLETLPIVSRWYFHALKCFSRDKWYSVFKVYSMGYV